MDMIARLTREHRELETLRDDLFSLLESAEPQGERVAAARWRLASALFAHCAYEDDALYARLVGSGNAEAVTLAWHSRRDLGAIGQELHALISAWPVARIEREWHEFGALLRGWFDRLSARIEIEERQLFPRAIRVISRTAA